jgi:hypothetical protein
MEIIDYAATKPRRPYWLVGVAIGAVALALAVWVAASPYLFSGQLRTAARSGDRLKMEEMIDFPRVREGLKSDLKLLVISEMDKSMADEGTDNSPFAVGLAQLAKGLVGAMMDGMVDQTVSPASLEKFAKGESTEVKFNGQQVDPMARLFPARVNEERVNIKARYLSYSRFRYVVSNNKGDPRFDIDLQRRGLLGWQVVRITPRINLESLRATEETTKNAAVVPTPAREKVTVRERQIEDGKGLDKLGDDLELDKIVGLKLYITPDETKERYGVSENEDLKALVVWGENYEILFPRGSYRYEHGSYVVDGFFLPKNGGMHQGIVSIGLEAVDEVTVRTNAKYQVAKE